MQYRPMEITVISAKGLKRVKHMSKMDVYVVVSLSGGPEIEQKTPVDKGSGPNPNWNFPMNFNVDQDEALKGRLSLSFKVMCHRKIHSDKDIGEVSVPVKELLDNGGDGKFVKYVTYQLRKPNGKHRGELNLSYKFANQVLESSSSVKLNEPSAATAYPPVGYPVPEQFPPPPRTFSMGQPGGFQVMQPQPMCQPGSFHMMQPQPMGYIPVYGNIGGFGSQDQQAFGFGFNPQLVRPQPQQMRPDQNGDVDAAFLSGVLGGLLIGDMLAGNIPSDGAGYDLGGGPYCDADGAGYEYDAPAEPGTEPVGACYEAAAGHEVGGGGTAY